MWVDLIQSAVVLNRTKVLTIPGVRENSSCLRTIELGHQFFPALGFNPKHWLFLSLQLDDLPCRSWGLPAFIIMWPIPCNKSISLSISCWFCFSGELGLVENINNFFVSWLQERSGEFTSASESTKNGVRTAAPPPTS